MRPTFNLCQQGIKLVLFSRPTCSLCDTAKQVVGNVVQRRPGSAYQEIDVMSKGNEGWKDLYEFDTPVLHVQSSKTAVQPQTTSEVAKLMHRFSEGQVDDLINRVHKAASD